MGDNGRGWFYVGDGWLRYRDEHGWSGHYVSADSVRGFDGPPPGPPPVGGPAVPTGGMPEAKGRRRRGLNPLHRNHTP